MSNNNRGRPGAKPRLVPCIDGTRPLRCPDDYAGDPPLEIVSNIVRAMIEHCRREAPLEACGILAGREIPRVDSIYPMRNQLASPTRYDADPRDILAAVRAMRANGERMLALYHSHPQMAAVPSRVDLNENYYGPLPRVIVSLRGLEPEVRAWRLDVDSYYELECIAVTSHVEPVGGTG